jgi:hypothetical protein
MEQNKIIITPRTKVFDLLDAYPTLEPVLIQIAPQFQKLKNPIIRKTVTKIATLSQAAGIAGIPVEELVNRLRREVGQDQVSGLKEEKTKYVTQKPDWHTAEREILEFDLRPLLFAGEHPVHEVLSRLKQMPDNAILEITAPFVPVPLIDKALGLGYKHWINELNQEEVRVYFSK